MIHIEITPTLLEKENEFINDGVTSSKKYFEKIISESEGL